MTMPPMDDHPHRELFESWPPDARRYIQVDACPGCGKPLRAFGEFITLHDPTTNPPLIALSAICWRCKHRIEVNEARRQEILTRVRRTMKLAVETGGSA